MCIVDCGETPRQTGNGEIVWDDLRRKLLQAYDRGEGTLEQLAERFSVSAPWAWKISAQRKRSGQMERVEQRRGGNRKVTAEAEQRLRDWVQAQTGSDAG